MRTVLGQLLAGHGLVLALPGGSAGLASDTLLQGREEEARRLHSALTACDRRGAGARGAADSVAAVRISGLVRVFEDRAAEVAREALRRGASTHGTASLDVAAVMNAKLGRRYEDMAEEMVREVFGLRETGFHPSISGAACSFR